MKRACVECGAISDRWRCERHRHRPGSKRQQTIPKRTGSTRKWRQTRQRVLERDGHRCVECSSTEGLTVDHIKAREHGGTDDDFNLITRCRLCHAERHGARPRQTVRLEGDLSLIHQLTTSQQLIALCGPPGSGKTTITQQLQIPSVSVDDFRDGDFSRSGTSQAFGSAYDRTVELLHSGSSVLFDSTAVTAKARASLLRLGRSQHVAISLVVLECNLKQLLERNERRAEPVPEFTITSMYEDYLLAKDTILNEGFRTVLYLKGGTQNL